MIDPAPGLRQRQRADGSWRIWWEPNARQRALGAMPVEFDAKSPGHASRDAARLNKSFAPGAPKLRRHGRSFNDLISAYRRDRIYTKLAASSRVSYDSDMAAVADKWGPEPVALADMPAMRAWYETLLRDKGAYRAKAILTMAGILMRYAETLGWRAEGTNPCARLRIETPAPRARRGSRDELIALLDAARRLRAWDTLAAILLEVVAGQRVNDVMLARAADFRQILDQDLLTGQRRKIWVWSVTQTKRGKAVTVPLHASLVPIVRLLRARARRLGTESLLINPITGQAWTKKPMWQAWDRVRSAAALACPSVLDLHRRDLRRTFGNLARAGGATLEDVQDVLGNTAAQDPLLRETYMAPQLATQLRAVTAIPLMKPARKRA